MLRTKDNNIDEILERYLPRASDEEVRSARDRFLVFLRERHEFQEALDNFKTKEPANSGKFVSLGYVDQLALTAAYLLRGQGTSLAIARKVNDLTPVAAIDTAAVFIALDRLERGRLLSTQPADTPAKGDKPYVRFTVTSDGERMLGEIRAGAQQLTEALADLARKQG